MKRYFTREQIKAAKKKYKKEKFRFDFARKKEEFISYLVSQEIPNWNIKLTPSRE